MAKLIQRNATSLPYLSVEMKTAPEKGEQYREFKLEAENELVELIFSHFVEGGSGRAYPFAHTYNGKNCLAVAFGDSAAAAYKSVNYLKNVTLPTHCPISSVPGLNSGMERRILLSNLQDTSYFLPILNFEPRNVQQSA